MKYLHWSYFCVHLSFVGLCGDYSNHIQSHLVHFYLKWRRALDFVSEWQKLLFRILKHLFKLFSQGLKLENILHMLLWVKHIDWEKKTNCCSSKCYINFQALKYEEGITMQARCFIEVTEVGCSLPAVLQSGKHTKDASEAKTFNDIITALPGGKPNSPQWCVFYKRFTYNYFSVAVLSTGT